MSNYSDNAFKPIPNVIEVDFSSCKYLGEIHKILKEKFGLPEYYGENWDALYDCLDGRFLENTDYNVNIIGFSLLPKALLDYCQTLLEIFVEIEEKYSNVKFNLIS